MLVFVEDAAEAVTSADVEAVADVRRGDGRRQCSQWPGVGDPLVGPVPVVEVLRFLAARATQEAVG